MAPSRKRLNRIERLRGTPESSVKDMRSFRSLNAVRQ
jgi:hypothetical protein